MSIAPDVLLERVYARLAATLPGEEGGWRPSPEIAERFGREPTSMAHRCYAAHLPTFGAEGSRQRADVGASGTEQLVVKASFRIRPKERLESQIEAYRDEAVLVAALMNEDPTWPAPIGKIRLTKVARSAIGDFFRAELTFEVFHIYPLR